MGISQSGLVLFLFGLISFTLQAEDAISVATNKRSGEVEDLDDAFYNKVRLSTVRLNQCSGTYVSKGGLIVTNHHCVRGCLFQNTSEENDVNNQGHVARSGKEELRCRGLTASTLEKTVDVSQIIEEKINALPQSVREEMLADIKQQMETECTNKLSGKDERGEYVCVLVSYGSGTKHVLDTYRVQTDVRLVFAPERSIAYFGGVEEYFSFPRTTFDIALLRAYDKNENPIESENYLPISKQIPNLDDKVISSGFPVASTQSITVAQLQTIRDVHLPQWLYRAYELWGHYLQFVAEDESRMAMVDHHLPAFKEEIVYRRNKLKSLQNDALFSKKKAEEVALQNMLADNPELRAKFGDPFADIEEAERRHRSIYYKYLFLEEYAGFNSRLFHLARMVVRTVKALEKESANRESQYQDHNLYRITRALSGDIPVDTSVEKMTLSLSIKWLQEYLGRNDPDVTAILDGRTIKELVNETVSGSKLASVEYRMGFLSKGLEVLKQSEDPMIQLALKIEPFAERAREKYVNEVSIPVEIAAKKITALYAMTKGSNSFPDDDFIYTYNVGHIKGWREHSDEQPSQTTVMQLFQRAESKEPFQLPESWVAAKNSLDLSTNLNFTTSNYVLEGSSGGPIINPNGSVVGVVFDGNHHVTTNPFWFDKERSRAVGVNSEAIIEVLEKVYGANELVSELQNEVVR